MDIDRVALLSVEELTLALPKVRLFKANSAGDMGRNVGYRESRGLALGQHPTSRIKPTPWSHTDTPEPV